MSSLANWTMPAFICLSSLAAGFFFGVQMMVWVYWRNEEEQQRMAEHIDEMHDRMFIHARKNDSPH